MVQQGRRKVRVGFVTSNKMTKTIVVSVRRLVRHSQYSRTIRQTSAFKVHDERNEAAIGDWVRIMETRPLSKDKRWRLVEIIKRAPNAPALSELPAEETQRLVGGAPRQQVPQQPASGSADSEG